MTTGNDLIQRFEMFANPALAESWDHVGLQLGNPERPVKRVMTALDCRPEVVQEAIEKNVDFIFNHHPAMFHAVKTLDVRDPQIAMYQTLLEHGITVYAAHTNLDNANGGMNDWLAAQLELTNVEPLQIAGIDPISGRDYGMGRLGDLLQPMSPAAFGQWCLEKFQLNGARLIVNPADQQQLIKRVAILGGSGQDFWQLAKKRGADAYVTGDVSYHFAHDMIASHLTVVDAGHHIEVVCQDQLASLLKKWRQENDWDFEIITSEINTEPFQFIVK
ncbi:Nif3-like dinuclear metal center hexameric protein [Limosilactobacillus mucosae]